MAPEVDFVPGANVSEAQRYESTAGALILSILVLAIAVLRNILNDKGQTIARTLLPEGLYNLTRDEEGAKMQCLQTTSDAQSDVIGSPVEEDLMNMTNMTSLTNDTSDASEDNMPENNKERERFQKKLANVESVLHKITSNFHAVMVEVKKRRERWEKERETYIAQTKELEGLYWGARHESAGLRAQCAELEAWAADLENRHEQAAEEKVWMEEMHKARVKNLEGTMRWMGEVLKGRELELQELREELAKVRDSEEKACATVEEPAAELATQDPRDSADYELAVAPFPTRRVPSSPGSPTPVCARDRPFLRAGVLIRQALRAHGGDATQMCKFEMLARCLPQPATFGSPTGNVPRGRSLSRSRDAGPSKIPRLSREGQIALLEIVPERCFPDGR